ncbi:MAG TPA: sialate O-acetylesterase [Puia sp.]|nr:sialate O-acetylesterase [Puia sp.]
MNKRLFKILRSCIMLVIFLNSFSAGATVRLPQLLSNHMVLQRDVEFKIWGWASPGEKVSVQFNGKKENAITGPDKQWMVSFHAMPAGGPFTMHIQGENEIILNDILMGDVWFCSGQSNMVLPMERLKEKYPEEVAHDHFPQIRNFFVPTLADVTKIHDDLPPGQWVPAVGNDILQIGGLTYFFARQLYQKYHIPIGIINSSVGGFPIQSWLSKSALKEFPKLESLIKKYSDTNYMNALGRTRAAKEYTDAHPVILPDKGTIGPVHWTDTAFMPADWHTFWMPGYWADQGVKGLHGILYFRKEIEVPASMTGMPAKLFLGCIVDADSTFVNGKFVGNITYQYPPRRYTLPAGLLKAGKNLIVIKLTNTGGRGGFVPDKNYSLNANGQRIDLRGDWTYQVARVTDPVVDSTASDEWIMKNSITGLFNTMVAPAIHYAIKGFLWNQGESNCSNPENYGKYLIALINDWRTKWNEGNIPFLYTQLANFGEVEYSPSESNWARMRQEQLSALTLPNTGMAVLIDAGEWNDLHPLDKKDAGERLALWAEHLAYGSTDPDFSGPVYQSCQIQGNKVIIRFSHTGSGLKINGDGDLYYFSVAGADQKFVWARAKIDGDKIIVWNDEVAHPVVVRYAWANNPQGANLYNLKGLPASPFETDSGSILH